jgi:hypothetical protein
VHVPDIKFVYLYRDGSNYKKWGEVVFASVGKPNMDELCEQVTGSLDGGELFIASQIRVPEVFLWRDTGIDVDDHCFHEFDKFELTAEKSTDQFGRTIQQFVHEIRLASQAGWRCFELPDGL